MTDVITIDAAMGAPEVDPRLLSAWAERIEHSRQAILRGSGPGSDFLGWLDPAALASDEAIAEIQRVAAELRQRADTLVVIGIGGSYLGARAAIEALAPPADRARVLFAGQNISASYHAELLARLGEDEKPFALNMISKSGTTTEPAIAFRLLRAALVVRVGEEETRRLTIATTDPSKGALRSRAEEEGLTSFSIPGDVGGRFSVLTAVGLLPMAFAGIDIKALCRGARAAAENFRQEEDPAKNPALAYAACRNALYRRGLSVEVLSSFEPRLHSLAEWWKQLFGESEGKDGMGLLPVSLSMTTDLHSLGQYVQDGRRQLFESFLWIEDAGASLTVPEQDGDLDGLAYLQGRELAAINREAWRGTMLAHREGGVPILILRLPRLDAESLGALFFIFEAACAVSGTLLGVNPFDQPAVEAYKKNMFALLGKPGFDELGEQVRARLARYESEGTSA